AFTRARGLCERLGDPPEVFPALFGIFNVHFVRTELGTARALADQLLRRAQNVRDSALLLLAHGAVGQVSHEMGELPLAREHLETAISLYDPERHRHLLFRYGGTDAKVRCLSYAAWTLCFLGYLDWALELGNEAVIVARDASHPHTLVFAEMFV